MSESVIKAGERAGSRPSALRLEPDRLQAGPGYIPSLDGLRAISVLLVVGAHHTQIKALPGGLGVYVFFVISGFLITRLLVSENKGTGVISLSSFYFRRFLRLYPAILTYSVIVVGLSLFFGSFVDFLQPLSALFYFSNYLYAYRQEMHSTITNMPFGIFWSLSLEEHFYLLFPLIFVALKGRAKPLLTFATFICSLCLAWRLIALHLQPELALTEVLYMRTDFRADSIAYGVLLAALCELPEGRRIIRVLGNPLVWGAALFVLLGSLLFRDPVFREGLRYSLQGAAIAILIAGLLFQEWLWPAQLFLNSRIMLWVGRLSYSIYVWHYFPRLLYGLLPVSIQPPRMAFDLACTGILGAVSYYCIERPALRLRHYLGSRARPAPTL